VEGGECVDCSVYGVQLAAHSTPVVDRRCLIQCACCSQALAQDDDDCFTNSTWANGKSLKQHFAGMSDVRIR
jgi:hypothetical protein